LSKPRRIEIEIARGKDGRSATPDDAIRAVEEALRRDPPRMGDTFVFLGLEYSDVDSLFAALRALQPLWE
jgi:hypothetical protein